MSKIDEIAGFGPINADPQREYVLADIAHLYNPPMQVLQQVLNGAYSTPTEFTNAYAQIQSALASLSSLAANGVVISLPGVGPNKFYLPTNLAGQLDIIVRSLQAAGIPLPANASTDQIEASILAWQNMKGFGVSQAISTAISGSGATAINSLQSYIELQYVKQGNDVLATSLGDLENALETSNNIMTQLNGLQNIQNQQQVVLGGGSFYFPPFSLADFYGITPNTDQSPGSFLDPQNPPTSVQNVMNAIVDKYGPTYPVQPDTLAAQLMTAWGTDANDMNSGQAAYQCFHFAYLVDAILFGVLPPAPNTTTQNTLDYIEQQSFQTIFGQLNVPGFPNVPGQVYYAAASGQGATGTTGIRFDGTNAVFNAMSNNGLYRATDYNTSFNILPTSLGNLPSSNILGMVMIAGEANATFVGPPAAEALLQEYASDFGQLFNKYYETFYAQYNPSTSTASSLQTLLQQQATTLTALSTGVSTIITSYSISAGAEPIGLVNNLYVAATGSMQQSFGQNVPIPLITEPNAATNTAGTVADMLSYLSTLQTEYQNLVNASSGGDSDDPASAISTINQVIQDILNQGIAANNSYVQNLQGVINWILDGQNIQSVSGMQQIGLIQNDLETATSNIQSLNDSQKQQVNNYMFIFQSFYQSASDTLSQLTEILQKTAKRIAH